MATLYSRRTAAPKAAQSVSDLIVRRSQRKAKAAPMLTEDIVPAGKYRSKIVAVTDAKSDTGKAMADITYCFTDERGKPVEARVRYPLTGFHIDKLFDALVDAGLPEDSPLTEAVGTEELVEITYPFEGALGKIKARCPVPTDVPLPAKVKTAQKPAKLPRHVDEDDEASDEEDFDDDFLEEDD